MSRILLLTGVPGVGKTTLVRRLAARLEGLRVAGFTTEEIREGGRRLGFRIVDFENHDRILAHVDFPGPARVGRYGVDVMAIEAIAATSLAPDPAVTLQLRDTESVPLSQSVEAFFGREVKPHVPDAWIDTARRDAQDGEVGIVGYEINFNRYFYEYRPPRPLEEIEADIQAVEKESVVMLREVAGA